MVNECGPAVVEPVSALIVPRRTSLRSDMLVSKKGRVKEKGSVCFYLNYGTNMSRTEDDLSLRTLAKKARCGS